MPRPDWLIWEKKLADTANLTPAQVKALIDSANRPGAGEERRTAYKLPADQKAKVEAALADMQKRIDEAKQRSMRS